MKKTFWNLLKQEMKKALKNKFFIISLMCGLLFAFISGLYNIESYQVIRRDIMEMEGNPMTQAFGLFNSWIGGESGSLGFTLFFTLLPLLAILPYGWSYCSEKKAGYVKMVMIRTGRWNYYLAKYIGVFLTGGITILIPLVFNLLFVASFVPAVRPTILYDIYYPMHYGCLWSNIFYTNPVLFTILYLMLDFVFAGLFAVMSYALSFFTDNRVGVILLPYFFLLALHYSRTLLYSKVYVEISPLNYLHAASIENRAVGWIVLLQAAIVFLVTFAAIFGKGRRYEDL